MRIHVRCVGPLVPLQALAFACARMSCLRLRLPCSMPCALCRGLLYTQALMSRVRATRLNINKEDTAVTTALNTIRTEAAELLSQLEDSYYSTPYRGRPVVADTAAELKELAAISLELSGSYSGVQQKK